MRQLLKGEALKGVVLILKWEKKVRWDFKNLSSSLFKSATFMMFSFTYCRTTSYFHYSIFFTFWCSYGYNMVIFLISTSFWNAAFIERSHLFWYECEKVRRLLEGDALREKNPNTQFFLVQMRENTDLKNSVFVHFSRSDAYQRPGAY